MEEQREAATGATSAADATNCETSESWIDRNVVVSVSGVVDMLTAPQLESAIRAGLAQKPAGVVVDFSAVEFLASAGMGILVAVHDEVAPDVKFCVVAEGPATSRPLKLLGIADIIPLYATVDEAIAALNA
ncbi:STAS domain-containing protein [Mycobacterium sp. 852013-51886_SCH5428379]|uniref:STAS domain-containing protein n=1 Tax=Mycobacteriaceae TaxID=1762 RepID=UPI000A9DBA8A|nr:STAS domain-containing protein [Mycobacterium sp. 852013-51886_SCH5428379]MCK0174149.1 STAS domain-containing protein [Mycolicibacterium sp. F2034L]